MTEKILKILIPVDFSVNTINTCKYAVNLINKENTEIHIFHILPDGLMVPDSSFPAGIDTDAFLNTEYLDNLRVSAKNNLAELIGIVKKEVNKSRNINIKVTSSILSGDHEWEIVNICKSFEPTFIVMGTKGEGNKNLLQGSMAKKIMKKVDIPVIAVPEKSKITIPNNILYATNFSEFDYSKIMLIFNIFKRFDIKIHVTHFQMHDNIIESQRKMENLKEKLKEQRRDATILFNIVDSKNKNLSLSTFCDEFEIDTISFISYSSNIFHYLFTNEMHKKDFFMLDLPMLALHE